MISLKAIDGIDHEVVDVQLGNLSAYDLGAVISYSCKLDREDSFDLRYLGANDESLLEIMVVDGLIHEIGLRCCSGAPIKVYDAPWTRSENTTEKKFSCRLAIDKTECHVTVGPGRIDQLLDFDFLIYKNAVVFMVSNKEVINTILLSREVIVLLDENSLIIGYVIVSSSHAERLKSTYQQKED